MIRHVSVHSVPPPGGTSSPEHCEDVSALDLPPALVFHLRIEGRDRWVTDPVELARYRRLYPDAAVEVLGTDRLKRPKTAH